MPLCENGHQPGCQIHRADEIVRFPVLVVLLNYADQLIACRIEDEVGKAGFRAGVGDLQYFTGWIYPVEILVGEVHKKGRPLLHVTGATTILVHPAAHVIGWRRQRPRLTVFSDHEYGPSPFFRPAFKPVEAFSVCAQAEKRNHTGDQRFGAYCRRPGTVREVRGGHGNARSGAQSCAIVYNGPAFVVAPLPVDVQKLRRQSFPFESALLNQSD